MRKMEMLRRRCRQVLAFGAGRLGGAEMMLLGRVGAVVLGVVVLLALLMLTAAVVFSRRDEPTQRLLALIRVFWH
jgi:hypothetical protein